MPYPSDCENENNILKAISFNLFLIAERNSTENRQFSKNRNSAVTKINGISMETMNV